MAEFYMLKTNTDKKALKKDVLMTEVLTNKSETGQELFICLGKKADEELKKKVPITDDLIQLALAEEALHIALNTMKSNNVKYGNLYTLHILSNKILKVTEKLLTAKGLPTPATVEPEDYSFQSIFGTDFLFH